MWRKVSPVKIVYMEEGVISRPDVVAIVKGTIHEAEAEQFVDFVTGWMHSRQISSQLDRRTVRVRCGRALIPAGQRTAPYHMG